jgi:hypothetical protein
MWVAEHLRTYIYRWTGLLALPMSDMDAAMTSDLFGMLLGHEYTFVLGGPDNDEMSAMYLENIYHVQANQRPRCAYSSSHA